MIRTLGARRDPLVLPILEKAASSDQPELRIAALEAMGDSGLGRAMELLAAEAKKGDAADQAKVRRDPDPPRHEAGRRTAASHPGGRYRARVPGAARHHRAVVGRGTVRPGREERGLADRVHWRARCQRGRPLHGRQDPQTVEARRVPRLPGQDRPPRSLADRDNCIGYAYAEIELDQPADAVLLLGVDDSEKIWVNGVKVHESFTPRGLVVDQDRVPVHLKAGKNTILLKLYQNTLGWEFCARLVTPDGQPLPFTQKAD